MKHKNLESAEEQVELVVGAVSDSEPEGNNSKQVFSGADKQCVGPDTKENSEHLEEADPGNEPRKISLGKKKSVRPVLEFVQSISASIILTCLISYTSAFFGVSTVHYILLAGVLIIPVLTAASWPLRLVQQLDTYSGRRLIKIGPRARLAAVHPVPVFTTISATVLIVSNSLPWEVRHPWVPLAIISSVIFLFAHGLMYLEWQFRFFNLFQKILKKTLPAKHFLTKESFVPTSIFITLALSIISVLESPSYLCVLLLLQTALYALLAQELKKVKPEVLQSENQDSKVLEPAANGELVLPYSSFAELERWYKQRFSLRSPWKLIFISAVATILLTMNVPATLLFFATRFVIGGLGGGQGASVLAPAQQNFSLAFIASTLMFFLLSAAATLIVYLRRPRGLAVGESGLRFVYSPLSGRKENYLDWRDIESIEIHRPAGKTSTFDDWIIFHSHPPTIDSTSKPAESIVVRSIGSRSAPAPLKIRLGSLANNDDKENLLAAIERYAPHVSRDARLIEALQRPADQSYTELWLQALSAPPQREKLKPLVAGVTLQDSRYQISRQLGAGGQGFAYLAKDYSTQEELVLKEFVLPIYVDVSARRQALERFEKEARLLAELDHPQVVRLAGFFVEDHRAYLVLEHIDGDNLRTIIEERGPLPETEIRALALQMAEILTYLHSLSPPLVHRDFTPDNLILGKDGKLKLIDFNVAQQMETATTGTVVGKQAYLPPEQFRGQATTASDLYAMGATLYFLSTGRNPVPISQSKPSADGFIVSEPLDKLISELTEIEETARPESAQSVLEIIQRWN